MCTTVAALEALWVARQRRAAHWLIVFGAIVVLWNPLFEVHLPRLTWHVLDFVAAILFLISVPTLRTAVAGQETKITDVSR